jgi:ATP-binding cassette subfamily C protein
MITALVQIVVYLALAFLISWYVTLAAALVGGLSFFALGRFIKMSRQAGSKRTELQKSFLVRLIEAIGGIKPIKAMALEQRVSPLLEEEIKGIRWVQKRLVISKESLQHLQEPIHVIAAAIGLYLLVDLWQGQLEMLFIMVLLFTRTLSRIKKLQTHYHDVSANEPAFLFIRQTIEAAEVAKEVSSGSHTPPPLAAIALRHVHFSYSDDELLRDVSLTIPAGRFVAVVGPSGVGKTTIADLIIGLVRPQSGEIFIGDLSLAEIDTRQWRRRIGYVPQETFLFHDTIMVNVTLADASIPAAEVEAALRRADAWDFVSSLPAGIESVVGERGAKLSGGQRQRIAIARALVRKPDLLILDEATTGLDPATEQAICTTLRRLAGEVTVLAISHQPILVEEAELVYRLDQRGIAVVKQPNHSFKAMGKTR